MALELHFCKKSIWKKEIISAYSRLFFTRKFRLSELINTIKFSLSALDNFMPKSPEINIYFYNEQKETSDTLLYEAQQHYPVIRQLLLWKKYKNQPPVPSLTIRANKSFLHYYRRFQDLSVNETNQLLYYIQETTSPKMCLPLSLSLSLSLSPCNSILYCIPSRSFRPSQL